MTTSPPLRTPMIVVPCQPGKFSAMIASVWAFVLADYMAEGALPLRPERTLDDFLDPVLQRRLRRRSGLVRDDLAILEHEQRGNAADAELAGVHLVFVHIDLGDLDLARVLLGKLLERGADLLAGPAPGRPEIDNDGNVGVLDFCVERGVGNGDGGHGSLLGK